MEGRSLPKETSPCSPSDLLLVIPMAKPTENLDKATSQGGGERNTQIPGATQGVFFFYWDRLLLTCSSPFKV